MAGQFHHFTPYFEDFGNFDCLHNKQVKIKVRFNLFWLPCTVKKLQIPSILRK